MNKNFTKEDIIKKHETNVKSANTAFTLVGVLGIIYVIRYFITGNFDFHFSLSVPEMMLKLGHGGTVNPYVAYGVTAVFFLVYILVTVLTVRNPKFIKLGLAFYTLDFLCLLFFMFVVLRQFPDSFSDDLYIEVIIHIFVILFLSMGVYSHGRLKKTDI
ncbi:MAG: hypothetical protein IKK60_03245 [Clostridia bacterium]|nr:hypothetical protein [Clostridia bacterium]